MKVRELRGILEQLVQLYVSAGSTTAAKDLQKITDALENQDEKDIETFIADIRLVLTQPPKAKKSRRASAEVLGLSTGADGIKEHLERLQHAGNNRENFDRALDQLKADKKLKLADLTEIAHRYSGNVTKYKSIRLAQEDISKTFVRNARFENKLR
jgi:hypothetical protein